MPRVSRGKNRKGKALPSGSHPISVSVQPIMYPQRINIKRSIYLRALLNDVTSNFTGISWTAHPQKIRLRVASWGSASGFTSSDKRTWWGGGLYSH